MINFILSNFVLPIVLVSLSFSSSLCHAAESDTREYKLKNGLKIIVREDHRNPILVAQIWYKVGSSYEPNGLTGISHALEHMMFRGTEKYGPGEFSRIIGINGGDMNAFTTADATSYYQLIEKNRLDLCFELEADRMQNLILSEDEFNREMKVIKEERRLRIEDNPIGLAEERFHAAAFISNPYHHPVIGWMNDIQNYKIEDLRKWYKSWYGPNNAVFVVVGDVDPDAVFKLAEKHFGGIKPITLPEVKPHLEVPLLGERRFCVEQDVQVPYLLMGYEVPNIQQAETLWEPYALTVLMLALDGGNSSRFSNIMIRDKALAANITTWYDPFRLYSTLMSFYATPTTGHTTEELELAFAEILEKMKSEPLAEDELKRIKAKAVAENIFRKDSLFYQATEIGKLESIGLSWKLAQDYPKQIEAVTPEQVMTVAKKFLTVKRKTAGTLIPLKKDAEKKVETSKAEGKDAQVKQ